MHRRLPSHSGLIGLGFLGLSAGVLAVEYLAFGHVRLLAMTIFLWLCLFYGLHAIQPEEKRETAPGVMESLCGFGLLFQVLTFLSFALNLSGWAALAPMLVFLIGLVVWLSVVLTAAVRRQGGPVDGVTYFRSGDFYSVGQQAQEHKTRYEALPSALSPELMVDPLGANVHFLHPERRAKRRSARRRSARRRSSRSAAE